ncbi:MAG: LemA family protein [Minisyncoccia bacterium]
MIFYIVLSLLIFIILCIIYIYNRLVLLNQRVKEALGDIDVQIKRRADLIPNLIETVKGYAAHEKEVFEKVTEARSLLLSANTLKDKIEADNMLTSTLKTLFAVAENYPELKANQNFLELQKELRDAEDKIMASRRFYNAVLMEYNSFKNYFPNSFIARKFNFPSYEYFEIEEGEKETPKVKF